MQLTNFHRLDCNNVGDLFCSPLKYYDFPLETEEVEIMRINSPKWLEDRKIIIGGGGLLNCDFFERKTKFIGENKKSSVIAWGCGHNDWQQLKAIVEYPEYVKKYDLVGLRDYESTKEAGYDYVPCVSCKSSSFDIDYEIKFDFCFFSHSGMIDRMWKAASTLLNKPSCSFITNIGNSQRDFENVIRSLGEAETIITSSYHGMYWGILLGKKVVAFPSSSKFYSLKYKTPLCKDDDWQDLVKSAKTYPEALSECREANDLFYQKCLSILK